MGWVVNSTPRPLYPRERTGTRCIRGWVDRRARLDGCGKYRPQWDLITRLPSPQQIAITVEHSRPIWWLNNSVLQKPDAFFFTIGCSGPTNIETWSDFSFWRELYVRQLCTCRLSHLDLCYYKRTCRYLTGFTIVYEGRTFLFKWKWHCSTCNASLTPALKCGRLFEIIFLDYKMLGKLVEKRALNRLEENIRMDFKDLRWDFVWNRARLLAVSFCSVSLAPVCHFNSPFPHFFPYMYASLFFSFTPSPTLSLAVT